LIEAIPDATILAREDPGDSDDDGISGRAGRTLDGRLARFGRKAEFATIEDFSATALHLEMGLTTRRHPRDLISGKAAPAATDPVSDPEVSDQTLSLLSTFVRLLAAPRPEPARSRAHADTVREGRRLFDALGCPACHTPAMRTGPNEIPALANRTVPLFSDLLLHDMGPALADVCGPTATPSEIRTELLMGLGRRDRFLHDARTDDITEAILDHGGEARKARDGFARLPWIRQQYLVIFLKSL
ncbi:MAG: di-heme oxidoredictase family protein, partial [Gemmatimonadales bacterium]